MSPFLFVTDLDNTLVGDSQALETLNDRLEKHRRQYGTKVVYATGRSIALYRQLAAEQALLSPDAIAVSVGTEIYLAGSETPDPAWQAQLSQQWDRDRIAATAATFADLILQPDSEQRQFKLSYYLPEIAAKTVLPQLEAKLQAQGLTPKLVYSSGQDLDILPQEGHKGAAMSFLRQHFGIAPQRTVACGDSGNDLTLFDGREELGIIVGNAKPELRQWYAANPRPTCYRAATACAAGILEGLQHFGLLEPSPN